MAGQSLKEKVEEANRLEWEKTEKDFFEELIGTVTHAIEAEWKGGDSACISLPIVSSDIEQHGKISCQVIGEYVRIVDRACIKLADSPTFKGFAFKRGGDGQNSDGYWGQPVQIWISNATD